MTYDETTPLGDVFNARDLTAVEVARRFIPPVSFNALLGDSHCVLEGPRGSGKTTLLRMLTPESFAWWQKTTLDSVIRVNFIGVFIPADVRWAKQMSARLRRIDDASVRSAVQQAIFSSAINIALIDTVERCSMLAADNQTRHPELFFSLSRETEANIVRLVSELWHLQVQVPSFNGLRHQLRRRQRDLGSIATQLAFGLSAREAFTREPCLSNTWLSYLVAAIQSVNDAIGRPEQRWAVLLDELEIVPPELLASIVEALRSTDRHLRFKIALSPAGSDLIVDNEPGMPNPGDDYKSIRLWYDNREEARPFSEKLFRAALSDRGFCGEEDEVQTWLNASADALSIEGSEEIDSVGDAERIHTHPHRDRVVAFQSLYAKDPSFKQYLDGKGIDPKNPLITDSDPNGSLVRKITPLVRFRDQEILEYDESSNSTKRRGGRRGVQAYIGFPNILDLAEGNPRWILNLADALATKSKEAEQPVGSQGVQSYAINSFVHQFVAKLRVYPAGTTAGAKRWSPYDFVAALGMSISTSLYDGPFNPEPRMSFVVDQQALQEFGDFIRTSIDLGALVIARRNDTPAPLASGDPSQGLLNVRVRITYRLAPHFRLPLRFTKEQKISSALRSGDLLSLIVADSESSETAEAKKSAAEYMIQPRLL